MTQETAPAETTEVVLAEQVQSRIYNIRGQNVMLDSDLAELYGVETKTMNRAVRRNSERFPSDFMFQLTEVEAASDNLRSQIVISNSGGGGRRPGPQDSGHGTEV